MNENFKDALYHLRWAGRHLRYGITETVSPIIAHGKDRIPTTKDTAEHQTSATTVSERIVSNLNGARRRISR